jgi:hypothetical protein
MLTDPALTLADQIAWIVELFCKTMAAEACKRRAGSLSVALWERTRRFGRRFCALYAAWKAGKLPAVRRDRAVAHPSLQLPRSRGGGVTLSELDMARTRPVSVMPRAFRWMQRMLPMSAGTLASGVGSIVWNHPEIRTFVAEVPQVGRILRPMCRLAGLTPPEWLALPKRRRVSRKDTSPRPSPQSGEGAIGADGANPQRRRRRTPREIAAAAIARSERTGKPIDPTKIGAVAFGYTLHWPRDGNCPPPEIGYGGRRRRPPKDYKPPQEWE